MIFPLCKWCFDISWHKFEKRWANIFQIYPNAIHLNPLQFCPSMPLLGFLCFVFSSSIVLNRYFHFLVNSMTIRSVLKLPNIAWPSPFNALISGHPRGLALGNPQAFAPRHLQIPPTQGQSSSIKSYHSYFGLCLLYRAIYPVPAVWIFHF